MNVMATAIQYQQARRMQFRQWIFKMTPKQRIMWLHVAVMPLLFILSWLFTVAIYGWITDFGYTTSMGFLAFDKSGETTETYRNFIFDTDRSLVKGGCTLDVTFKDRSPLWTITSRLGPKGLDARIFVSNWLVDDPDNFDRDHYIPLVTVERPNPGWLFRYNRDIRFDRPIGPLRAELKSYAGVLATQKNSGLTSEDATLIASKSADIIDKCHGLSTWGERFPIIRLISGPIQELILILCVFSTLIIIFESYVARCGWTRGETAIESAEVFVDLVPYVGFFGTIYGMAQALWYLGGIDLSDPVAKATQIGPITGNISLAMEASQLGILFFLVASIVLRVARVAMREPT